MLIAISSAWIGGCAGDTAKQDHDPNSLGGPAPSVTVDLAYSRRSIFSNGSSVEVNNVQLDNSLRLHMQVLAMADVPSNLLDPIQEHIRLVLMSPQRNMLSPAAHLTPGTRYGFGDATWGFLRDLAEGVGGDVRTVAEKNAILPQGVMVDLSIESKAGPNPLGNRFRVLITRGREPDPHQAETPRDIVKMAIRRSATIPGEDQSLTPNVTQWQDPAPKFNKVIQRAFLNPIAIGDLRHVAFVMPFAWDSPGARALVLLVTLERVPDPARDPDLRQAFTQCVHMLKEEAIEMSSISGEGVSWSGCLRSLDMLVESGNWRRALVHLVETTPTALARDVALAAGDSLAQDLAGRVHRAHMDTPVRGPTALGWLLEQQAYLFLLDADDQDLLDLPLETLLIRHAGQLGRQRHPLRETLIAARDRADFQRRLLHENQITLEDMSPSSRVRAFEWLTKQGQAPDGYDPLASARQRRAALDASLYMNIVE